MTKTIHPVPSVEEGPAGPAIHPQLFISQTENVLEISALPLPNAFQILASTIIFSGVMLFFGCGAIVVLILKREDNWSFLVISSIGLFAIIAALLGFLTLGSVPGKILNECAYEVLEVTPEKAIIRRTIRGLTFWEREWDRKEISSVELQSRSSWDGSSRTACVLKVGRRQRYLFGRLPATAVQHAVAVLSEFMKLAPEPELVVQEP